MTNETKVTAEVAPTAEELVVMKAKALAAAKTKEV